MTEDKIKAELAAIEVTAASRMDSLNPAAQALLHKAFDGEISWEDYEREAKKVDPAYAAFRNRGVQ